jgi:DNA-binding NarL/FixJ family response regulator
VGKPRILLADDHTLIVEAFKKLLESEFEIVGTVPDGRKLLQVAPSLRPDVVLLDLGMPMLNGFDAGRQLKKLLPNVKLIVLTVNEDYDLAVEALGEWASGYLLKSSASSELVKAIWEVLRGKQYVTPQIAKRQLEEFVRDPRPNRIRHLTARQREVLQLLGEGRSMKEAAFELQVATRTIAFHKYRIMEEHGLKTNSDLVIFAIKQNVLSAV